MLTAENYHMAWLIYGLCSLALLLVFARLIWAIPNMAVKLWLLAIAACLLYTPVPADPSLPYLAPATLVFLLEVMFIEGEKGTRVLPVLTGALVGLFIVLTLLNAAWFIWGRRWWQNRVNAEPKADDGELAREALLEESVAASADSAK